MFLFFKLPPPTVIDTYGLTLSLHAAYRSCRKASRCIMGQRNMADPVPVGRLDGGRSARPRLGAPTIRTGAAGRDQSADARASVTRLPSVGRPASIQSCLPS